jgi:hypothetical protein
MYGNRILYRIATEQQDRDRADAAARRRTSVDQRRSSDPPTVGWQRIVRLTRLGSTRSRQAATSGRA